MFSLSSFPSQLDFHSKSHHRDDHINPSNEQLEELNACALNEGCQTRTATTTTTTTTSTTTTQAASTARLFLSLSLFFPSTQTKGVFTPTQTATTTTTSTPLENPISYDALQANAAPKVSTLSSSPRCALQFHAQNTQNTYSSKHAV